MSVIIKKNLIIIILIIAPIISGCLQDEETENKTDLVIALEVDEGVNTDNYNPQILADYIESVSDYDVTIYNVNSEGALIEALRFGNADIALMDAGSGWIGWQQHGLEVLVADLNEEGKSYYNSHAWVKRDSEIGVAQIDGDRFSDPYSLLAGKDSCHTGWLKSTGMLLPMGFLIGHGYANIIGDPDDVETIRYTIYDFFGDNSSIPDVGTQYYGYEGALRCLSEGGGEVAFGNENTVDIYCGNGDNQNRDWCDDEENYVQLPSFGKSPSNPLMYNPEILDNESLKKIEEIFTQMHNYPEGKKILSDIFYSTGFVSTNSSAHLSTYSALMSNIPGISAYYNDKYELNNSISTTLPKVRIGFENSNLDQNNNSKPELLGDYLSNILGIEVEIQLFESESKIIESLSNGDIDIGFMAENAAWYSWKQNNLAVMAAIVDEETGTSNIKSVALVRSDSDMAYAHLDDDFTTEPLNMLDEKISCHPSKLDSYGTLVPIGKLIKDGHIATIESDIVEFDSLESIQVLLGNNSSIPQEGTNYYGDLGALKCLSEGYGEIAFTKYNTLDKYCHENANREEWCLEYGEYLSLPSLGEIPTKSVMYNPNTLDIQSRTAILNALISLNYKMYIENYSIMGNIYTGCYDISVHIIDEISPKNSCGSEILTNIFNSEGITPTNSQDHLGKYSELISKIPNILEYQNEILQI